MQSKPLLRPIQNHQLMSLLPFAKYACFHMMLWYPTIEVISLIPFTLLSFAWTRLFSWSSNTTIHNFGLYFNTMWNTIKLAFLLNFWYILLCNIHVYAIYSIFCSTLSKLVRPLIVLSFNSSKPTRGLDALSGTEVVLLVITNIVFFWHMLHHLPLWVRLVKLRLQ
jgi:hypothetical protein